MRKDHQCPGVQIHLETSLSGGRIGPRNMLIGFLRTPRSCQRDFAGSVPLWGSLGIANIPCIVAALCLARRLSLNRAPPMYVMLGHMS